MSGHEADIYIRSAIYSFIFVFGICGNIFVIFFFRFKMKQSPSFRWFVIYLAISDCVYAFTSPIQIIAKLLSDGKWKASLILCKMVYYIGPITVNVSAFVLTSLAYERYRAICYPFSVRFTRKHIHLIVAFIWLFCICAKIPAITKLVVMQEECFVEASEIFNVSMAFFFLLFESVIPILFQVFFLFKMQRVFKNRGAFLTGTCEHRRSVIQHIDVAVSTSYPSILNLPLSYKSFELKRAYLYLPKQSRSMHCDHNAARKTFQRPRAATTSSIDRSKNFLSRTKSNDSHHVEPFQRPRAATTLPNDNNNKHLLSRTKLNDGHQRARSDTLAHVKDFLFKRRESLSFGIKNKRDRATVHALFFAVLLFVITSLPYNIYYCTVIYLLAYKPEVFTSIDIDHVATAFDWLGVLLLSSSIANVFVYGGSFPSFRHQMYLWFRQVKKKISMTAGFDETTTTHLGFNSDLQNTSYGQTSIRY